MMFDAGGTRTSVLLHVNRPLYHCATYADVCFLCCVNKIVEESLDSCSLWHGDIYVIGPVAGNGDISGRCMFMFHRFQVRVCYLHVTRSLQAVCERKCFLVMSVCLSVIDYAVIWCLIWHVSGVICKNDRWQYDVQMWSQVGIQYFHKLCWLLISSQVKWTRQF